MRKIIYGAQVWTMTGTNYAPGLVAFDEDGIIRTVEDCPPSFEEEGVEIIDGRGQILLPGFIEAHCHVGLLEENTPVEGNDLNETSDPITPQMRALDGINPFDPAFEDALQGGVTTVCILPGSANIVGGQATIMKTGPLSWSERVVEEQSAIKCALGENPKRVYGDQKKAPITRMASAALLREAFTRAKAYQCKKEKAKEPLTEPDLRWEALLPLLEKKIPLRVHAHRSDDILTALRIAKEFDLPLVIEHCTEGHLIAEDLAEAKVSAVVGPSLVNRAKVEMKEITPRTSAVLHKASVPFAIMTDHPVIPIQYLPLCAGLAVKHGLEEEAALKAISISAAQILGLEKRIGTIEVGKEADLVLWKGHPFDIRSSVTTAWVKGKKVFPFLT
ncbi:amidohydrolase family protein [Heliorestis acidaminivorans]|uniref:Amidohydrolase family protein n=1 Tax=Heliorestis acidaminivorans TaxID=553427 RepID=A0A6I0F3W4_9FIRM|nr:amidohydrolase [Heliorestis acidaminivorans]KAB2951841.1 amidohydrolase family protein [Heliorestis acidaminivorans]